MQLDTPMALTKPASTSSCPQRTVRLERVACARQGVHLHCLPSLTEADRVVQLGAAQLAQIQLGQTIGVVVSIKAVEQQDA